MKPLTQEWVDKADGDFATAGRELRVRKAPNYDSVGFHAQQCVEKYMKAHLLEASVPFPKTHDLDDLLGLLVNVDPFWITFQPHFRMLTDFAVSSRYPGDNVTREEAREAFTVCRAIRKYARQAFGIT
jgi:HEPN domain-containing protein